VLLKFHVSIDETITLLADRIESVAKNGSRTLITMMSRDTHLVQEDAERVILDWEIALKNSK